MPKYRVFVVYEMQGWIDVEAEDESKLVWSVDDMPMPEEPTYSGYEIISWQVEDD